MTKTDQWLLGFYLGKRVTTKEHKGTFWGDGIISHTNCDTGYTTTVGVSKKL